MADRKKLGELLTSAIGKKAERSEQKRYSQYDLARDSGTVQPHIYRVIRGQSRISHEMLLKVCRALNCSQEEATEIFQAAGYYLAPGELDQEPLVCPA